MWGIQVKALDEELKIDSLFKVLRLHDSDVLPTPLIQQFYEATYGCGCSPGVVDVVLESVGGVCMRSNILEVLQGINIARRRGNSLIWDLQSQNISGSGALDLYSAEMVWSFNSIDIANPSFSNFSRRWVNDFNQLGFDDITDNCMTHPDVSTYIR